MPRGGGRSARVEHPETRLVPKRIEENVSGAERPTGEAAMGRGNAAGDGERDAPEVVSAVRVRVYRREREREREDEQTKRTHGARLGVTRRRRLSRRRKRRHLSQDDVTSPDARVECRHARKRKLAETLKSLPRRERKKTIAVYIRNTFRSS